jgi:hypothetical protein
MRERQTMSPRRRALPASLRFVVRVKEISSMSYWRSAFEVDDVVCGKIGESTRYQVSKES